LLNGTNGSVTCSDCLCYAQNTVTVNALNVDEYSDMQFKTDN